MTFQAHDACSIADSIRDLQTPGDGQTGTRDDTAGESHGHENCTHKTNLAVSNIYFKILYEREPS